MSTLRKLNLIAYNRYIPSPCAPSWAGTPIVWHTPWPGLTDVWQIVDSGGGIYFDGSFIQHSTIPYTGS